MKHVKIFLSLLLFFSGQFCFAGSASKPITTGEWSETTNGLRGRLLFAEDKKIAGTRMGVIYLELQNSSLGDTMHVYYDAKMSPFRCKLQDSVGKTNPTQGADYDGFIPEACWLALPYDSTLRFRVTLGGFGIPQNGGLFIAGCLEDCWVIPASAQNDYFLTGTLRVTAPKNETRPRVWEGTLKLPPVKIPIKPQ